jgi:GntR family transcriptional regulator of arabinose operon
MPTVRQLQQKFEVSTYTVFSAFNLLEKQGLVSRKHGSGCYLSHNPKPFLLSNKTCYKVGFIHPDFITENILNDIVSGIEQACSTRKIKFQAYETTSYANERKTVEKLARSSFDALIVYPIPRTSKQARQDFLASELPELPIILMDLAYPFQKRTNVVFDNYQLGFDITIRLLKEGHRNIAFNKLKNRTKEIFHRSNNDRYQGYMDALSTQGIDPRPGLCWPEHFSKNPESEEKLAQDFLETLRQTPEKTRPSAVICLEDRHAAALIRCAKKENLKIPEDLKVIGFDNNPQAREDAGIPFPTTSPDFFKMGTFALNLAVRETKSPSSSPLNYVLPVDLNWV